MQKINATPSDSDLGFAPGDEIIFSKDFGQFDEIEVVDLEGRVIGKRKRLRRVDPRIVLWEIDQFLMRLRKGGRRVERICLSRELLLGILEFLFGPKFLKWKQEFGEMPSNAAFRVKYDGLMLVYEPGIEAGKLFVFIKDVKMVKVIHAAMDLAEKHTVPVTPVMNISKRQISL